MNRGLVTAHVTERYIKNPTFVVRPAGQRKVRETGRKNVHAFVKGEGLQPGSVRNSLWSAGWVEVSYNPYRETEEETAPFYVKATGEPVFQASEALLTADRKLFVRF
jgi:hypothetical protein